MTQQAEEQTLAESGGEAAAETAATETAERFDWVLVVQLGSTQQQFPIRTKEEGMEKVRTALSHGFLEIEGKQDYALITCGPNSGTGFLLVTRASVEKQIRDQQLAQMRAQQQMQQAQASSKLVLPGMPGRRG